MGLLNRESDQTGKSDWLTMIKNGTNREKIVYYFIQSDEFIKRINKFHLSDEHVF